MSLLSAGKRNSALIKKSRLATTRIMGEDSSLAIQTNPNARPANSNSIKKSCACKEKKTEGGNNSRNEKSRRKTCV